MIDERDPAEPALDDASEARLRNLMQGAFSTPERDNSPDVLRGVQQKLRDRSGGKFYTDGWSTIRHAPISTFLVTGLAMLVLMLFVVFALAPLSGRAERVRNEPAPVELVTPSN